ncbi:hypothetical protein ACFL6U_23625 [Planctomycetota bacterium]
MNTKQAVHILILAVLLLALSGCSGNNSAGSLETQAALSPDEARAIAKEAYVYGFPIVMNYKTLYN